MSLESAKKRRQLTSTSVKAGNRRPRSSVGPEAPSNQPQSFEVTRGGVSGDMLTEKPPALRLKVGFLGTGYFEYWRMYGGLREQVAGDMQRVADRLATKHPLIYPGLVDTVDAADRAGQMFRDQKPDLIVIAEGTWTPDYFIHQALAHVPTDTAILVFAGWNRKQPDGEATYDQALRSSGPMGLVQLTAGFRKMRRFPSYEVVVGVTDDEKAYQAIDRFIRVRTAISRLRGQTLGVVGHVFRGMYDFNFDKTAVTGLFGPEIVDIHIDHLTQILSQMSDSDPRIMALQQKVYRTYEVVGLEETDVLRASRLAVALIDLLGRYRLDGLALLGQHYVEMHAKSTVYLGLSEILANDHALAVTEGDVLGLIVSMLLKEFSGHTPFFGEWDEVDVERNALMILGHGFLDPREAHAGYPVQVNPPCEEWGFEGKGFGFQANYRPGPATMAHVIADPDGWRMLLMRGEILDVPPLPFNECSLFVHIEKPVMEFWHSLLMAGFPHHVMVAPGDCIDEMNCLARQLGIQVCRF
jgi:L-arabinose isomerase